MFATTITASPQPHPGPTRTCLAVITDPLILERHRDHHSLSATGWSLRHAIESISPRNAVNDSADNRSSPAGTPRSVQSCTNGNRRCPSTSHTNTNPRRERLVNTTPNRCPHNGWNGWVTTTEPKEDSDV
jgi:hypothetical protein